MQNIQLLSPVVSSAGATQHEDRPHAMTLVRVDRPADAMLAAARVTHFPVNFPVLYVYADRTPPETFAEMKRLAPDGNTYDNGVQVYLVGAISPAVERDVETRLGYKTRDFRVDDPVQLSDMLDKRPRPYTRIIPMPFPSCSCARSPRASPLLRGMLT